MAGADLCETLSGQLPELRGTLTADAMMSEITWFRIGGPAQVLFRPADEDDLVYFLKNVSADLPVFTVGLGSNLLVRDGGVRGVVIRLGRGFGEVKALPDHRVVCGTAVPDVKLARAACDAGIDGLAFYRGIPGSIGGALRMNAGAHGTETKDVLVSARAVDRRGNVHVLSNEDMGYDYRHCGLPTDYIFTQATFQGRPGEPEDIARQMEDVASYREEKQPTRARTGGSTFKNPPGHSAWKLVDGAGCRGMRIGGAMVSELHCNFLINDEGATGEDVERLGETVRARVKNGSGVQLNWEIIRVGEPVDGRPVGEALAVVDDDDVKRSA